MTTRTMPTHWTDPFRLTWSRALEAAREAVAEGPSRAQAVVYREVAVMLAAGVPITRALQVVAAAVQEPRLGLALNAVRQRVNGGQPLSSGMRAHPEVFSPMAVELVRMGEETGSLDEVLARLADHFEGRLAMGQKLRATLTYPLAVTALSLGVLLLVPPLLLNGVFALLNDLGVPIPPATRLLMQVSEATRSPWTWLALALLVGIAGWLYTRAMADPARRLARDRFLLALRGVGPCLRQAGASSFAASLALCVRSGLPLVRGLRLSARGTGNLALQEAVEPAVRLVQNGESLARALSVTGLVPRVAQRLLVAGEEAGQVDEMLERCSAMAAADLERSLETAVAALEPAVLLTMGLVVGGMALAVLSPLLTAMQAMAL